MKFGIDESGCGCALHYVPKIEGRNRLNSLNAGQGVYTHER